MLRTTLVYVLGVFIALGILVVSLFAVTFRAGRVRGAVAVEVAATVPVVSPTPISYKLPYPGLLPDSPFWFLKAARDQVVLFLTFDLKSKAEKELLIADKRLAAAEALINGGKIDIGVSTAIKGEKYLKDAVELFRKSGKLGAKESEILERVLAKHGEVISVLRERTPELNNSLKEAAGIGQGISDALR